MEWAYALAASFSASDISEYGLLMVIIEPSGPMPICVPESELLPVTGLELLLFELPGLALIYGFTALAISFKETSKPLFPVIAFHIAPLLPLNTIHRKKTPPIIRTGPSSPPPPPLLLIVELELVGTPLTVVEVAERVKPITVGD